MSIFDTFTQSARAQGLYVPEEPDRLRGSAKYNSYLGYRQETKARLDRLADEFLSGKAIIPGQNPGEPRTDAKGNRVSGEQAAISDAMIWEWANYLARLDNDGVRVDGLVPMASQALTFFYDNVYEIEHAELTAWDGKILKIDRRVDPAANDYAWYEKDLVGVAKAANSYSTMDIPVVGGPAANANTGKIVPWLVAMEMNFMDLRREAQAKKNGKPDFQLYQSKVQMCQRAIAEGIHFQWMYGDAGLGIDGLMNNPNIATIAINGAWSGKTALQILDDLQTMAQAIPNATQGQLGDPKKIRILLPPEQYNRASNLLVSAAGTESVLSYFTKTQKIPEANIQRIYDFAAANSQMWIGGPLGLSSDRAVVIYDVGDEWDPAFVLSQPIEIPAPPRQNLLSETTAFHARAGGAKIPDARRIRFVEGL